MDIRSLKAFFGNDSLDLTLRRKFRGLGIQWIVGAHPSSAPILASVGDGLNYSLAAATA